jgi:hypothetical protein
MKPIFDISSKKSFTVWESGGWTDDTGIGSSILVADPSSNKMKVIYDLNAEFSDKHALFYANIGCILAGCFVSMEGTQLNFNLEVSRITSLTTVLVQERVIPTADTEVLYLSHKLVDSNTEPTKLVEDMSEFSSMPNIKDMMMLAIQKALTIREEQRIFYGIPRVNTRSDDE